MKRWQDKPLAPLPILIVAFRRSLGYSQKELAAELKKAIGKYPHMKTRANRHWPSRVSTLETGESAPTVEETFLLADVFQISRHILIEAVHWPLDHPGLEKSGYLYLKELLEKTLNPTA